MPLVGTPSETGWPAGAVCHDGWRTELGCWLGCLRACTGPAFREGQDKRSPRPGLRDQSWAASFKVKLKESEKSKLEPGLPGHHESILVRAEGEKTLYLIVYLANGL